MIVFFFESRIQWLILINKETVDKNKKEKMEKGRAKERGGGGGNSH